MKPIQDWFDEYGISHQNKTNKIIHSIFVPLIFFSLLALVSSIPCAFLKNLFPLVIRSYVHFGTVVIALGILFYLRLSVPMTVGLLLFSLLCLQGIVWIEKSRFSLWSVSLIIFVISWIAQFIGHKIEGKKPSFFKDLQFLMIGPAWLLGFIYRKIGIRY